MSSATSATLDSDIPALVECYNAWFPTDYVRDYVFYILRAIATPSIMKKGILVHLYGTGNNGKTTFTNLVRAALCEFNKDLELFDWAKKDVKGKRYIFIKEDDLLLTPKNIERAKNLLEQGVSILCESNTYPNVAKISGILMDRYILLHFTNTFTGKQVVKSKFWSQFLLSRIFSARNNPDYAKWLTDNIEVEDITLTAVAPVKNTVLLTTDATTDDKCQDADDGFAPIRQPETPLPA